MWRTIYRGKLQVAGFKVECSLVGLHGATHTGDVEDEERADSLLLKLKPFQLHYPCLRLDYFPRQQELEFHYAFEGKDR